MPRVIFNILAILSGLLCIFLIYSWVRSYFPAHMRFESVDGTLMVLSWQGQVSLDASDGIYDPGSEKFFGIRTLMRMMSHNTDKQWLGFRHISGGGLFRGVNYDIVAIPYWVLILPTAILPVVWLIFRRRTRDRRKAGHCKSCGYDLRESKDKCPECGVAVAAT